MRASWNWYLKIMGLGLVVPCVICDNYFALNRLRQSPIEGTTSELLEMMLEISEVKLKRHGRGPFGTRDSNYENPQITLILLNERPDSLQCGFLGSQQTFDCED